MSTYVIGDVQGCYDSLCALLDQLHFDPQQDTLWFVGDLVNRGAHSLEVLRFVKALPNAHVVLGNHDLHLLVLASGVSLDDSTLEPILNAPDRDELLHWLRHRPLMHSQRHFHMVHAGILPTWTIPEAQGFAREAEAALQDEAHPAFLQNLYGNTPSTWSHDLTGIDRLRFIVNALTRMRFVSSHGALNLADNGPIGTQTQGDTPWFQAHPGIPANETLLFGHWASLAGNTAVDNIIALDTGCVWGKTLSAFCLETQAIHSCSASATDLL